MENGKLVVGLWLSTLVVVSPVTYGIWKRVRPRQRWFAPAVILLMVVYSSVFLFTNVPLEVTEAILWLGLAVLGAIVFQREGDRLRQVLMLVPAGVGVAFWLVSRLMFYGGR